MIKIVRFIGGLGNQMFQYAFYLSLRKKHPLSLFLFDIEDSRYCHNGFELPLIFSSFPVWRKRLYYFINSKIPRLFEKFQIIKQTSALQFDSSSLQHYGKNCIYSGYWQTEKFFLEVSTSVKKAFRFDNSTLSNNSLECESLIQSCNSVSIHIRRGDYLNESSVRGTFGDDYYIQAIEYIENIVKNPIFFIFSDDKEYVKHYFNQSNVVFVDWNKGKESWQDMYLMSKCKHNIIANSSFSWWGAWLNSNEKKIVIAPKLWFFNEYNDDIIPVSWIRI